MLPFVSIIVVNYNGKHYLDDCLTSLHQLVYPSERREVIVVDNGSADGSIAHLRTHFPWVRVLAVGGNVGFARANNLGIDLAQGELIALLNNDTAVDPHWLDALVEEMQRDPSIGGMTSKILFKANPSVINSVGLNLYRDGRGGDRGFRQQDEGQFEETAEVFGGCGASLLLRRRMLDDIGAFDERFFMYCEDLDLAWRARLRGWSFWYTPRSIVHHVHCGTSGEWSPFFLYYAERNRVFVNVKNAPALLALRTVAVFAAKALRKWVRVVTLQERRALDRGQAWAYFTAALSLAVGLPGMLGKRCRIRARRRRIPDRAFAHLLASPPTTYPRAA